jgi:septum formation protein
MTTNPEFPFITKENPLILASASPRRKRLLEQIGLPFLSMPSNANEDQVINGPSAIACGHALKKATAIKAKAPNRWILGADTIVVLGESILGKPQDHSAARSMLYQLSGKEHRVITCFCLVNPAGELGHSEYITTRVRMKKLKDDEISGYIETGEPFGKAGSYAVQGIGSFMVDGITGDYSNVVGLPVCALIKALKGLGALRDFPMK